MTSGRGGLTRRRTRPRRRSTRAYSIAELLARQPRSLAKDQNYATMVSHYESSERLRRLRVNRRCYSLLHNARIEPHNLHHFYRTYRLPENPFFPLFFAIKRNYLSERDRTREQRRRYILERMRSLPAPVLDCIRYVGYLERSYNGAGNSPVWQRHVFAGSKKRADAYTRFDRREWLSLFAIHLDLLQDRYPGLTDVICQRVLACFTLGIVPQRIPPARPAADEIARVYRRLSLLEDDANERD